MSEKVAAAQQPLFSQAEEVLVDDIWDKIRQVVEARKTIRRFNREAGPLIVAFRKERNLSQPQLAKLLEISESYLSKIENSAREPSDAVMARFLELAVSDDLLNEEPAAAAD